MIVIDGASETVLLLKSMESANTDFSEQTSDAEGDP